jgi:hypothetical protein
MKNKLGGPRGTQGEGRGEYRILLEKPDGNRPHTRPRRRWEDSS